MEAAGEGNVEGRLFPPEGALNRQLAFLSVHGREHSPGPARSEENHSVDPGILLESQWSYSYEGPGGPTPWGGIPWQQVVLLGEADP